MLTNINNQNKIFKKCINFFEEKFILEKPYVVNSWIFTQNSNRVIITPTNKNMHVNKMKTNKIRRVTFQKFSVGIIVKVPNSNSFIITPTSKSMLVNQLNTKNGGKVTFQNFCAGIIVQVDRIYAFPLIHITFIQIYFINNIT